MVRVRGNSFRDSLSLSPVLLHAQHYSVLMTAGSINMS